jgi:hypothetical protein
VSHSLGRLLADNDDDFENRSEVIESRPVPDVPEKGETTRGNRRLIYHVGSQARQIMHFVMILIREYNLNDAMNHGRYILPKVRASRPIPPLLVSLKLDPTGDVDRSCRPDSPRR